METLKDLLRARGLSARCPSCDETFSLRRARLFDATKPLPDYARTRLAEELNAIAAGHHQLSSQRAELQRRSFTSASSSGIGQTLEMIAASLPGLPTAGR